jgi:hypothetical protein
MATKDVTDRQVCEAYLRWSNGYERWPYEILSGWTGEPEKVCYRACERAAGRGLVEYGVSLRSGWLTEAGKALLEEERWDGIEPASG